MSKNCGWNANQLISLLNGDIKAKWSCLFDAELAIWRLYTAPRQPDASGWVRVARAQGKRDDMMFTFGLVF